MILLKFKNLINAINSALKVLILEKRYVDGDSWGFYFGGHMGDLVIFSSISNELCIQRGGKRVVLFVPQNLSWIPSLFPSKRIKTINLNIYPKSWRFLPSARLIPQIGRISPMHPDWLVGIAGWNRSTFLDFYLSYLQLDPGTLPEKMKLPNEEELKIAYYFMKQNNFPVGKTVLLCPEAFSVGFLPEEKKAWGFIISELVSAGYTVGINASKAYMKNINLNSKVKLIFPPLALMRGIALLSGIVIAKRSGLVDLLAGLPIRMIVIYGLEPCLQGQDELSFYSQRLMKTSSSVVEICGAFWWNDVLENVSPSRKL